MIGQFLQYALPWWVWIIPSAAIVGGVGFLSWRFLGFRNTIVITALFAIGLFAKVRLQGAKQEGWNERIQKEKDDASDLVKRANDAGRDVLAAGSDRLHDDDGFKRKK